MAAIVTVTDPADLVKFRTALALSGPLPRILTAVSEEDVGTSGVETTLVDGRLVGLGELGHVEATESIRTHAFEVLRIDDGAPHGLFGAHRLEPAILSAVLERPGTSAAVDIDLGAGHHVPIIVSWVGASLRSVLNEGVGDGLLIEAFEWL